LVNFDFLSGRGKERKVFDGILSLLDTVSRTVDSFEASVSATADGDAELAMGKVKDVFESETKADEIHRDLSLKIAEGAFFGGVREDILNLMEKIDNIADSAKDAARFLASDSRLGLDARPTLGSSSMKLFLADLKKAVAALIDLVQTLEKGKEAALAKIHTVEDFEEEADTHKDALLKELFDISQSMDAVSVIQLRDFIFVSDDVADSAEDASDVILVLIAKGYG
jgi:uncharacterized protein